MVCMVAVKVNFLQVLKLHLFSEYVIVRPKILILLSLTFSYVNNIYIAQGGRKFEINIYGAPVSLY